MAIIVRNWIPDQRGELKLNVYRVDSTHTTFFKCSLALMVLCLLESPNIDADEKKQAIPERAVLGEIDLPKPPFEEARGHFVSVPFPLTDLDDRRLRLKIQQMIDRHQGKGRPIVVLQFVAKSQTNGTPEPLVTSNIGRGTEFERSLSLARWLVGPVGVRARTIAYLVDSVEGHAVLVAMACEEIAMSPLAELGRASIDESSTDQVVVDGYLGVAQRRSAFPPDAVRSMLDREASLYKVELVGEQNRFVSLKALEPLRQAGQVNSETQLSIPGQLGKYTGQEMRAWRWITHLPRDKSHLQELVGATTWEPEKKWSAVEQIKPALIEIRGAINQGSVNRWLRAINEAQQKDLANLMILHIHSPGGSLSESLRMAEHLANLDDSLVETVAWVDGEARGDAALIALACDSMLMKPNAVLGGPGEATINADSVRKLSVRWQHLSELTNRTEGELYGLVCQDLSIHEFTNQRGRTEIGDQELFSKRADFKDWQLGGLISFPKGIEAEEAVRRNWATSLAPSLYVVAEQWGIDKLPAPKRVSQLEQWIRSFAEQDWLATLLLTLSLVFFTNELSTPGLGLAGFLSLLCISLFFWMKFLDGTVEWLEITLCVCGLLALGLEIFVLPGFGIFGFGGLIMLGTGIVLASQTFIIPSNDYQWSKLALSTGQIAIACIGLMTTIYLLRNQLERMPFFRLLKLEPPVTNPTLEIPDDLSYLVGALGITTTRCAPFGKALVSDQYWDVQSQDDLLNPNTEIRVVAVNRRTIFVERVSTNASVS